MPRTITINLTLSDEDVALLSVLATADGKTVEQVSAEMVEKMLPAGIAGARQHIEGLPEDQRKAFAEALAQQRPRG